MEKHLIKFGKNQKLPPGYHVYYYESTEHYGFEIDSDENFESLIYCDRFMAYRSAHNHYIEKEFVKKLKEINNNRSNKNE